VFSSLESLAASPAPLADAPGFDVSSRFELFDRAGRWLEALAASQPLLICLEDLHAADVASLEMLEALTPRLRTKPVVLLATSRDGGFNSETGSAFHRLVRLGRRLNLGPMNDADARALLGSFLADDGRHGAIADEALAATGGHPLFLVELGRLVSRSTEPIDLPTLLPVSLDAALRNHLETVAAPSRQWLSRAAIIGVEFDEVMLGEAFASHSSEVDAQRAVAEAARLGLLVHAGGRRWRFFHALLRELLLSQLEVETSRHWHEVVATWLESRGDSSPARLAHHLLAAGPVHRNRAIDASLGAAQAALDDFAFDDARAHLDRIAEDATKQSARVLSARVGMLRGLADIGDGAHEQGRRRCFDAADVAFGAGDVELAGHALLAAGSQLQFGRVDDRLVRELEAILAALEGDHDSPLRVRLLARLAAAAQPAAEPSRPIAWAHEAIGMAERVGDDHLLIDTLRTATSALVDMVPASQRRPIDDRHLELALRLGRDDDVLTAHVRLVNDCFELGDGEAVERHIDAARQLALASSSRRKRWLAPALLALKRLWAGRLDDTLELIEAAYAMGEAIGDRNVRGTYAFQRLRFIELDGAEPGIARAAIEQVGRTLTGTPAVEAISNVYAAQGWFQLGQVDEGLRRVDRERVRLAFSFRERSSLIGIARWAYEAGDVELARAFIDTYGDSPDLLLSDGVLGLCFRGSMSSALCLAHATLDEWRPALQFAERAVRVARQHEGWPAVAEAHAEAAHVALRLGDAAGAAEHEAMGRALVTELDLPGLRWRFDRLDEQAAGARQSVASEAADLEPEPDDVSAAADELSFIDEGEVWWIRWRQADVRLKHTKGLRVVGRLVAEPGREFHVLDLADAAVDPGSPAARDGGEILDAQARASYRARATDLRESLAEAETHNDYARHAELSRELEFLTDELARATGLGGRERRNAGAEERARQAVRKQIRGALDRISDSHAELGKFLAQRVRTGRYCAYEP